MLRMTICNHTAEIKPDFCVTNPKLQNDVSCASRRWFEWVLILNNALPGPHGRSIRGRN